LLFVNNNNIDAVVAVVVGLLIYLSLVLPWLLVDRDQSCPEGKHLQHYGNAETEDSVPSLSTSFVRGEGSTGSSLSSPLND
jgi:hypothetical protein